MLSLKNERESVLGYKPQKEIIYNDLLPYADQLNDESQKLFAEIKEKLGQSVIQRDVFPSISQYTSYLTKYVRLYGRLFSKEDHIALIKLQFELLAVPNLDFGIVQRIAHLATQLLKKKELISRDDLIIPWRPLYKLYENTINTPYELLGMLAIPANMEATLKGLIRASRVYFSVESTQEMLDEWRPLICPYDSIMSQAMSYFELFLPTTLPPEHHDKGFKLWFDEFMAIWNSCHSTPAWENSVVWLFSRVAQQNIGYINWEPYIPAIFTRIIRSFSLPGGLNSGNNKVRVTISRPGSSFDILATTNWIAAILGGGSSCQSYINKLFKALESYYHPSNIGRWMTRLQRFLHKLPSAIVKRINRERYRKPTWETPIPREYHLTDAEITEFVKSIKPVVLLSMFSKSGSGESAVAVRFLSTLRPEIIIPPILERLYSALETLTEPHRLTASMNCLVAAARALVCGGKHFPEGPSHVIPLLMSCLPGIDPNDIRKCMATFQFMSTFVTLIPVVDCSSATHVRTDLNEVEQDLCLATASFEDFVLQFMDRCFVLIQNSCLEHPTRLDRDTEKMTMEENIVEVCVSSAFSGILTQCSPAIYESALRKLHSFVSGHIFETKVSGKYATHMCRSAARVNPKMALQMFLPHFSKLVLTWTDNDEVAQEETLNDELLFSLLLLSEVVRCDGREVMKYSVMLEKVLNNTLHLISRQGYLLAGALLRHILRCLTLVYTLDFRSIPTPWEECLSFDSYNPLKDWGKSGDIHNLGIKWHVPSEEELQYAQNLLDKYLNAELVTLEKWMEGKKTLSREELRRTLSIVLDCLMGAGGVLPPCQGDPLTNIVESTVELHCQLVNETGCSSITFQGGKNVREVVTTTIRHVLEHIMNTCEDDTKALFLVIKIYRALAFYWGVTKDDFDRRWKGFHAVKKALENKLLGSKQHIRTLLIDRAQLQHEMRLLEKYKVPFSSFHRDLMADLLSLSTSHYSEVRAKAQELFQLCLRSFSNHAYRLFVGDIIAFVKNESSSDEQFKGALYTLLGYKNCSLLLVNDWEKILEIWPAIVQAKASEKPSIIKLQDQIVMNVQRYFETIQIKLEISDGCVTSAKKLWESKPLPNGPLPSEDQIKAGIATLARKSEQNLRNYNALIDVLVDQIQNGNLHWRNYNLAMILLNLLIRCDVPLPPHAVRVFVQNLIHERLIVRKLAITGVGAILKQQKRKHPKVEIEVSSITQRTPKLHPVLQAGIDHLPLPDNFFLQYNSLDLPETQEKWDKTIFIHQTYVGFYEWPKHFKVYAPDDQQPKLDRKREELDEAEKEIYDCFSEEHFVEELFRYLSLEEKKGHDKFDVRRFNLFKGLFRNFGDIFLPLFLKHLEKRVADNQESMQRCAAEIISSLLSASKHWNFSKMESLRKVILPILATAFNNITSETMADWGTCIATASQHRNPNKYHWLFEMLMEDPLREEGGSFLQASRLYLLHGALAQQQWRVCELQHRLLAYLLPYLTHSYQNVRERIGSLLGNIFQYEMNLPHLKNTLNLLPKHSAFIKLVLPQLQVLNVNGSAPNSPTKGSNSVKDGIINDKVASEEPEERKNAAKLLKTVSRWLITGIAKGLLSAPPEIFQFLPMICHMQSDTSDEELRHNCTMTLATLGQAYLLPESIDMAIKTIKLIIRSTSWHARTAAISFLQFLIFSNLFTIMKEPEWVKDITTLVVNALQDERVEVRESAAEALGGLLHCEFVTVNDELLDSFKVKCSKKLRKRRQDSIIVIPDPTDVIERHAGILGLCACINAYPYEVPEFMPDVLMILGDHLNDPQPIPTTVKKTLSNFRRTHHDSWQDHKLKFTDDQLAVITDLLVSPSYYA